MDPATRLPLELAPPKPHVADSLAQVDQIRSRTPAEMLPKNRPLPQRRKERREPESSAKHSFVRYRILELTRIKSPQCRHRAVHRQNGYRSKTALARVVARARARPSALWLTPGTKPPAPRQHLPHPPVPKHEPSGAATHRCPRRSGFVGFVSLVFSPSRRLYLIVFSPLAQGFQGLLHGKSALVNRFADNDTFEVWALRRYVTQGFEVSER